MAQFGDGEMINGAQGAEVLFLVPRTGDLASSLALLARRLEARMMPLPEEGRRWRLLQGLRRALREAETVVSFCPEGHVLSVLAGGRGVRRVFVQSAPPMPGEDRAARLFWRLLPWLARRGMLAAPTPMMRRNLAARAGTDDVLHLPLPVALPEPLPAVGDLRERAPLVLFPGALKRAHQPGLAVKAMRHLPEEVRLVLSGEGESARALRHMVDGLGLARRVRWLAPGEDWRDWLARARVACLPARFAPWVPQAVLALAHGLPLVGTETPGLHALLADCPDCGTMVDMTDDRALAAALAHWLKAPGEGAPRQARARQYAPEAVAKCWRQAINP